MLVRPLTNSAKAVWIANSDSLSTLENWVEKGTLPPNQTVTDTAGVPGRGEIDDIPRPHRARLSGGQAGSRQAAVAIAYGQQHLAPGVAVNGQPGDLGQGDVGGAGHGQGRSHDGVFVHGVRLSRDARQLRWCGR